MNNRLSEKFNSKKLFSLTARIALAGMMLMLFGLQLDAKKINTLAVKFSDVILSGLTPNMIHSLKKEQGIPYTVVNGASSPKELEVLVLKPRAEELMEGYESIPDESWIKVIPSQFRLGPGEEMDCDLIISIPEGEEYNKRHYQAMLKTRTVEKIVSRGSVGVKFSLMSRIRFSTGETPAQIMDEYRDRIINALKINVMPLSLEMGKLPLGEKLTIDGLDYGTVQLINRGKEDYNLELKIARNILRYSMSPGYEQLPDDIKVSIVEKNVKLKGRNIHDVAMKITIPDKEEYRGKKYAFAVLVEIKDMDIPLELFSRVYFKVEE